MANNRRERIPVPFTSKGTTTATYHRLGIRIPAELARALRAQADRENRSVTAVTRLALQARISDSGEAG
jgi:hypothetical protein